MNWCNVGGAKVHQNLSALSWWMMLIFSFPFIHLFEIFPQEAAALMFELLLLAGLQLPFAKNKQTKTIQYFLTPIWNPGRCSFEVCRIVSLWMSWDCEDDCAKEKKQRILWSWNLKWTRTNPHLKISLFTFGLIWRK